jgi:hypothetical protein
MIYCQYTIKINNILIRNLYLLLDGQVMFYHLPSVISWWSILLVEETGLPGKPLTCHKSLTNLNNVVSSTPRHEQGLNSQL